MPSSSRAAPLLLRLALGITFVWSGMGKLFSEFPVQGERAALLSSWGVLPVARSAPPVETPAPTIVSPPSQKPLLSPPPRDGAKPGDAPEEPSTRPVPKEPLPEPDAPPRKDGRTRRAPGKGGPTSLESGPRVRLAQAGGLSADDFSEPIMVRRVYGIALRVYEGAHPSSDDQSANNFPLWPKALAKGRWPVYFAWLATISELAGGGLLLVGLLTRLASAAIGCTMIVALWLTEIGPAIQSGHAMLWFLPNHPDGYKVALSPDGYVTLLWLVSLLAMSWAVFLLGPGMLSLDGAMMQKPAPRPAPKAPPAD